MTTTRRKRRPDPASMLAANLQARRRVLEGRAGGEGELAHVLRMLDEVF